MHLCATSLNWGKNNQIHSKKALLNEFEWERNNKFNGKAKSIFALHEFELGKKQKKSSTRCDF